MKNLMGNCGVIALVVISLGITGCSSAPKKPEPVRVTVTEPVVVTDITKSTAAVETKEVERKPVASKRISPAHLGASSAGRGR